MDNNLYKRIIEESGTAYSYQRIICDDEEIPCDYEFLEVNSAFEALTGLKGSDIIGRKFTEVFPCSDDNKFEWAKFFEAAALNGGDKEFEYFAEKLKKWYKVKVYSPERHYYITLFSDISGQKAHLAQLENLEKVIKETEFKFKVAADYSYDWETWEDEKGRMKYVSPACERTSGFAAEEFLEDGSLFASLILEEDKGIWENHRHEIESDKGIHSEEFRIRNKNGKIVWIEHTCRPVFENEGRYLGYRAVNRDITERKQAEEEILESKNLLVTLLESIPVPVFYKDIDGRYIGVNKAYEKFFGTTKNELIGKSVFDISPKNLARIYHEKDAKLFQKPGTQVYESQVKDARGFLHDVIFYKATMTNYQGRVTGLIGTILDITGRKYAENALKKSEEKYRLIFEHTPLGVLHFDNKGRIIDCNDNIVKITGSTRKALIGLNMFEYFDKNCTEVMKEALKGKIETYEGDCRSLSEDKITAFRVLFAPILSADNKAEAGVGIVENISERKKLETAIANEKKLLETTLKSVGDGVISTDNQGSVVFLNKAAELLTGWTQEDAGGCSIDEVFHVINEYTGEKQENIIKRVIESGKIDELTNQTILISKDGTRRPIEASTAPIVQEKGEIVGAVLVFRDFSEKKQKQEEIRRLSYHDQLTGLYNRRFYEEKLKTLDAKDNLPLTIAMGDVNGLKLINDSFGHVMGDQLLKKVAEEIKKGCRPGDIAARLGGDEFVIILPKTNSFETEKIIKSINYKLSKDKIGSMDISVSFGYETKTKKEEKIEDIFKNTEDKMYKKKVFESPSMRGKTIKAIINTLYEKNKREEQHSHRVSFLCKSMGEALGLSEHKIEELKTVGLLHDIGKIAIDENILNKPDKLTEAEWKEIKRHSEVGYRILNTVNDMADIAVCVLYHHERWDGKGYPKGLKGKEIPYMSRIITIADSYDAMTSERAYRGALPKETAIEELKKDSGIQFDPELVTIFIEKVLGNEK